MNRSTIGTLGVAATLALIGLGIATGDARGQEERAPRDDGVAIITQIAGGAYLGVRIEEVTDDAADRLGLPDVRGVRIDEVVEDGPAAEAGLMADDILVSWNGTRLESVTQLQRHMRETPAGRTVDLGVFRDGREREIPVTLGDRSDATGYTVRAAPRVRVVTPGEARVFAAPGDVTVSGFAFRRGRLGVSVQNLSEQLASYFGVSGGALITSVAEDTPAERAGLEAGDVIIEVGGRAVEDPGDLIDAISDSDAGPVDVRVVRDRNERSFTVELEEPEERQSFFYCDEDEECADFEGNWERWADEYGANWESWAENFADRWEVWADQNSGVWEEWAERWEHQWEEWAEQFQDAWRSDRVIRIGPLPLEGQHAAPIPVILPAIDVSPVVVPNVVPQIDAAPVIVTAAESREI